MKTKRTKKTYFCTRCQGAEIPESETGIEEESGRRQHTMVIGETYSVEGLMGICGGTCISDSAQETLGSEVFERLLVGNGSGEEEIFQPEPEQLNKWVEQTRILVEDVKLFLEKTASTERLSDYDFDGLRECLHWHMNKLSVIGSKAPKCPKCDIPLKAVNAKELGCVICKYREERENV